MSEITIQFCPEVRERTARMVLDDAGPHGSGWQASTPIAAKIECSAGALPGLLCWCWGRVAPLAPHQRKYQKQCNENDHVDRHPSAELEDRAGQQ